MTATDIEARQQPPNDGEHTEKGSIVASSPASLDIAPADSTPIRQPWHRRAIALLGLSSIENGGAAPTPLEERTDRRAYTAFTLWFTMNCNILPITFGMLGPELGCSLRDSALVILFFTLLTAIIPAYLSTLGPKTGMRQMIQARFSFGRYIVGIPVLLNLATLTGFCIIMVVIGGQCLSAVSSGHLSPYVGIVIVSILSLVISFSGYKVLHIYEAYSWIPALIAIVVAVGCGGSHLREQTVVDQSPASSIVSFAMVVASYMLPWACIASDFFTYLDPKIKPSTIFCYSYLGLCVPTILLLTLGAAIAGVVGNIPSWTDGYDTNMVGGVMADMLSPAKGFGKFMTVVLAFSLLGNISATSYAVTLNFQLLIPILVRVPRYLFAVLLTAIIIPVGIFASKNFFNSLNNFITLIGYWSSAFLAVVLIEHLWFRKRDCAKYSAEDWDTAARLPPGIAAISTSLCSVALIVPSMDQVWWVGPIAKTTGDLGFEFAFIVTGILYIPFRALERKYFSR